MNEKSDLKLNLIAISPALIYALIYSFMVFIFKTWEDFYYINNVIEVIGFFAFPLIILLLLGCNLLAACLDIAFSKYIKKRCKK